MSTPSSHITFSHLRTLSLSALIAGSVLGIRAFQRSSDSPSVDFVAPPATAAPVLSQVTPSESVLTERLIASFSDGSVGKDFILLVEGLPIEQLYLVSESWAIFHQQSPELAEQWMRDLAAKLTERDLHERALDVMAYLPTQDAIPQIERLVFRDWLTTDEDQLRAFVDQKAEEGAMDEHHASILASLFLNEGKEQWGSWRDWIANQKGARGQELQGLMIGKLAHHTPDDQLQEIGAFLSKHLDNRVVVGQLPQFAARMAKDNPEDALTWVAGLEMPDDYMRAETFGRVLYDTAQTDPDRAWELLSADDFLTRYYQKEGSKNPDSSGEWDETAQQFFDMTLNSYISGMVLTDPESAIASADSFFNQELGENVKKELKAYVANHQANFGDGNENTPHVHGPDCAGCNHPTHN